MARSIYLQGTLSLWGKNWSIRKYQLEDETEHLYLEREAAAAAAEAEEGNGSEAEAHVPEGGPRPAGVHSIVGGVIQKRGSLSQKRRNSGWNPINQHVVRGPGTFDPLLNTERNPRPGSLNTTTDQSPWTVPSDQPQWIEHNRNPAWAGTFLSGWDRPLVGIAGDWQFISHGPGSSEELAKMQMGNQGLFRPDVQQPSARDVHEFRKHRRRDRRSASISNGIDIVWRAHNAARNQPPRQIVMSVADGGNSDARLLSVQVESQQLGAILAAFGRAEHQQSGTGQGRLQEGTHEAEAPLSPHTPSPNGTEAQSLAESTKDKMSSSLGVEENQAALAGLNEKANNQTPPSGEPSGSPQKGAMAPPPLPRQDTEVELERRPDGQHPSHLNGFWPSQTRKKSLLRRVSSADDIDDKPSGTHPEPPRSRSPSVMEAVQPCAARNNNHPASVLGYEWSDVKRGKRGGSFSNIGPSKRLRWSSASQIEDQHRPWADQMPSSSRHSPNEIADRMSVQGLINRPEVEQERQADEEVDASKVDPSMDEDEQENDMEEDSQESE